MLAERPWLTALLVSLVSGCAVDLDSDDEHAPLDEPAPLLESCALLEGAADGVDGLVSSVTLLDGSELLVTRAKLDGTRDSTAFSGANSPCGEAASALAARPVVDVSELSQAAAAPRAGFTTDAPYLYFSVADAAGFEGSAGVARFDEETGTFRALALLWTGDRPSYGASAGVSGRYVYVYGGLAARFLAAGVSLARVPRESVAEASAYEYFGGGGQWTPDADLARPIVEGGQWPSVTWNAEHERFLMAYTTPLASEITVRTGLGPSGPWSLPGVLGRCALPFAEAFCSGVSQLPSFSTDGGLAFAQTIQTFEPPAGATERDYWTRPVRAACPDTLP